MGDWFEENEELADRIVEELHRMLCEELAPDSKCDPAVQGPLLVVSLRVAQGPAAVDAAIRRAIYRLFPSLKPPTN